MKENSGIKCETVDALWSSTVECFNTQGRKPAAIICAYIDERAEKFGFAQMCRLTILAGDMVGKISERSKRVSEYVGIDDDLRPTGRVNHCAAVDEIMAMDGINGAMIDFVAAYLGAFDSRLQSEFVKLVVKTNGCGT